MENNTEEVVIKISNLVKEYKMFARRTKTKATRKIQAVLLLTAKLTAENTRRSNDAKYPAGF